MIISKRINYKGNELKSTLELYFFYYLEELQAQGFVEEFWYEKEAFKLSESIHEPYLKLMKTKIEPSEELILRESTYTPDFQVKWLKKAANVFYLDRYEATDNRSNIMFRLGHRANVDLVGYYEVKPMNESKLDSSKEFPTLSKWIYDKYGILVQKIKPFDSNCRGCLFEKTFTPHKVLATEIYARDCKYGFKGQSKLKYPIFTLETYLKRFEL